MNKNKNAGKAILTVLAVNVFLAGGQLEKHNTYSQQHTFIPLKTLVVNAEELRKQISDIDTPRMSSIIGYNAVVEGWSLNESGIKTINFYVDSQPVGSTTPTVDRPDVLAAYKGYGNNSVVGFRHTINLSGFPQGKHAITIEMIGNDGTVTTEVRNVNLKAWDPILYVDEPVTGAYVNSNSVRISGWATADSGISSVRLLSGNTVISEIQPNVNRPDVMAVYRNYNVPLKSGYEFNYNLEGQPIEAKNLRVEITAADGTQKSEAVRFTTANWAPELVVDYPESSSTVSTPKLRIQGWAINPSEVKKLDFYIDNKFLGSTEPNIDRPDVKSAYHFYNIPVKTGYSFEADLTNISNGNRTLKVVAEGHNGKRIASEKNIKIYKWNPETTIDYPSVNTGAVKQDILVKGWGINPSGIKDVTLLLNDKVITSTSNLTPRPDVKEAYYFYNIPVNSGYEMVIPYRSLTVGKNLITVKVTGNDGTVHSTNREITIWDFPSISDVDSPSNFSTYNNKDITISGWALQSTKISAINIYLNDKLYDSTTMTVDRPDVKAAFPIYENSLAGYTYNIKANSLLPGTYKLKLEFVGVDGKISYEERTFTLKKEKPEMALDTPANRGSINDNKLTISGWALNDSGVKDIKIYFDNALQTTTNTSIPRPDVLEAYKNYKTLESGYSYTMDLAGLPIGEHVVKVVATGNDGTVTTSTASFNLAGIVNYYRAGKTLSHYVQREFAKGSATVYNNRNDSSPAQLSDIDYYMNPNNFISHPVGKYMFLKLTYADGISASNLNSTLTKSGVLTGKGELFLNAGRYANVNPIYLVAHASLETGNGVSELANGILVTTVDGKAVSPRVVYNVYGIGAKDEDAVRLGAEEAYKQGWFTVDQAIVDGAKWIGESYITSSKYKQNTLYKMRFNLSDDKNIYWHQYATDVAWAYKQTNRIKALIDKMDRPVLYFEVPVFD